jgi:hypothetical protein
MNQWRTCACMLGALLLTGCTAAGAVEQPADHALTGATVHTAAGAAVHTAAGHVTGRLLIEGGPMGPGGQQPGERPIPGTVTFLFWPPSAAGTRAGHRPVAVGVGRFGKFSVWLAPGRYQVTGRSPDIITVTSSGKDEERTCGQASVTVTARHAASVSVFCIVP